MDSWLCIWSFTTIANSSLVAVAGVQATKKFAFVVFFFFGVCAFYCIIHKMNKARMKWKKELEREIVKEGGVCA